MVNTTKNNMVPGSKFPIKYIIAWIFLSLLFIILSYKIIELIMYDSE